MTDQLRLLVCVDGSPASLAASRLALDLAEHHEGRMRAVSVVENPEATRSLNRTGLEPSAGERRERGSRAVLDRIETLSRDRGVPVETALLEGEALRAILRDARDWDPDLVLIGRSGRAGPGSPMMGSLAMHVVEFADWPVIVVPEAGTRSP